MLTTSAAQKTMFAGHNITFTAPRILMTLPVLGVTDVSAQATNVQVKASLVTDQPDGTRFEVGYPALELTFTFADTDGLFAPYNTTSSIYRQTPLQSVVTCDWGTPTGANGATEWLRKFTGQVDSYKVNIDGTVEFTCIDNRSLLRGSGVVSPVVTAPPFNAGLTSEFGIDYLLRRASNGTISSWPAQRDEVLLAVGMRSSLTPEVGSLDTGGEQPVPTFAPGVFGSALAATVAADGGFARPQYNLGITPYTVFIEFWVTGMAGQLPFVQVDVSSPDDAESFAVVCGPDFAGGAATVKVGMAFGTQTFNVFGGAAWDDDPHYIACQVFLPIAGATTATGTLWVDSASFTFTINSARAQSQWDRAHVSAFAGSDGSQPTVEAVQITSEFSPALNNTFDPQAILDPSLNALQVIPAFDPGADVWQILQQIADAESGVAGLDESTGKFYFRNRDTLRTSAPVATLTSSESLKDLGIEMDAAALANRVQVPYQGWTFAASPTLAAQFASAHYVNAQSTRVFRLTTDQMVAQIDSVFSVLPNTGAPTRDADGNPVDGNSWFRVSLDKAGTTEHPGVTVTAVQVTPTAVDVTVTNDTGKKAWFVVPSNYTDIPVGTPSLWLGGLPVTQGDQVTSDTGTTFKVNPTDPDVTYQAPVNPWVQDGDTADALAFRIGDDMSGIQPQLTNIDVVPRPDLQLGDRVILQDPDVTSINEQVVLWGWTLTAAPNGDSMQIDGRAVAGPGQWILDDDTRSILDSTTYI